MRGARRSKPRHRLSLFHPRKSDACIVNMEKLLDNVGRSSEDIDDTSRTNETPVGSEHIESSAVLIKKRKRTSDVWNHFVTIEVDGVEKALCNYCKIRMGAKPRNGTKHLHNHLLTCPKRKNKDVRQQFLAASQNKSDNHITNYYFDQGKSRRDLVEMIIMHEYPLNIVEHVGFKKYSAGLQPLFKIISRNTVASDILKIYAEEKEKMTHFIQNNKSRIAITSDMWTSSNQKRGYMVITCHFIDESWILQNKILRFAYVPCPHTSEALSNVLMESFLDYNIDRKLSCITLDNCSTNDALINILLEKISSSSLVLCGDLFHMRCSAHILDLIVKDGLEIIFGEIDKIRDSVVFWTATPKREEKFEEAVKQLKIECTKKLSLDCKTRWNSTFLMLETAIIYKDLFHRLKQRESMYKCLPTEDEWEMARVVCGKLKIFYNVTTLFSGTRYPTTNVLFPKICEIKIALHQWLTDPNDVLRAMAQKMIDKFNKYWGVVSAAMAVGVVLDPRYKMKLLEWYFPLIYGNETSNELLRIRNMCYDLVSEYQYHKGSEKENVGISLSKFTGSFDVDNDLDPLSNFDKFVSSETSNLNVRSELDHYLEDGVLPRSQTFDLLLWWKSNGMKFPTLQFIARDFLAIPVSTVASEYAFSTSGRVLSTPRSRLKSLTLEALMCTQSWLWDNKQGSSMTIDLSQFIGEDIDDNIEVDVCSQN